MLAHQTDKKRHQKRAAAIANRTANAHCVQPQCSIASPANDRSASARWSAGGMNQGIRRGDLSKKVAYGGKGKERVW